ncbi:unnamed protein product, partial [Ectocarpus sp. 6 AP-2014]
QDVRKEDALLLGSVGQDLFRTISRMTSTEFRKRANNEINNAKELGLGALGKGERRYIEAVQTGMQVLWGRCL